MTYRVAGAFTMESAKLAPIVDHVMGVQLGRLRRMATRSSRRSSLARPAGEKDMGTQKRRAIARTA